MIKAIHFVKMQALGNDFVIIEKLTQSFHIDGQLIKQLAHRRFGIGCDQVLILESPLDVEHDFSYQVYNSNGSMAMQCLNGVRCLGHFVNDLGLIKSKHLKMQTQSQTVKIDIISHTVSKVIIPISDKIFFQSRQLIDGFYVDLVCMGNQHAVCWDLPKEMRQKFFSSLKDHGIHSDQYNISFATVHNQKIFVETFERGAGKTLSCGSAALSSFYAYHQIEKVPSIRVENPTGYMSAGIEKNELYLTGPVGRVFHGQFLIKYKSGHTEKRDEKHFER